MTRRAEAMFAMLLLPLLGGAARGAEPGPGAYILGPEDQITVRALHVAEIGDKPVAVSSAGFVALPLIGVVEASGKTVEQLAREIQKKLTEFYQDPQVSVAVTE